MKIGMRTLKTALAVFLCVCFSKLMKTEYPFYVVIAAIVAMQDSVSGSFRAGINRMLGTTVGAGIGLLCALIQPQSALLSAIGIIILIQICNLLQWKGSIVIGGIVFSSIMVNMNGRSPVFYSLNRILDTFIGIGIALLINYFIVPPKELERMEKSCVQLVEKVRTIVENSSNSLQNLSGFEKEILVLEENLSKYISNCKKARLKSEEERIEKLRKIAAELRKVLLHCQVAEVLAEELREEKEQTYNFKDVNKEKEKEEKEKEIEVIIEYHRRIVRNTLQQL